MGHKLTVKSRIETLTSSDSTQGLSHLSAPPQKEKGFIMIRFYFSPPLTRYMDPIKDTLNSCDKSIIFIQCEQLSRGGK